MKICCTFAMYSGYDNERTAALLYIAVNGIECEREQACTRNRK